MKATILATVDGIGQALEDAGIELWASNYLRDRIRTDTGLEVFPDEAYKAGEPILAANVHGSGAGRKPYVAALWAAGYSVRER